MALVHSYIRFSQTRQASGDSLDRQTRRAAAWCKRNKHTLSALTYKDLGVSSFRRRNATKGALSAFLLAIESGKISKGDILLIENIDRLSRSGVKPTLKLIGQIHEANVDIQVLTPEEKLYKHKNETSTDDLIDLIILAVQADVAYKHSQRLSDLNKQTWSKQRKQAEEEGTTIPGSASWWLVRKNDKWIVEPEKGKLVKNIYKLAIEGDGVSSICRKLNQTGIPSPKNGDWNKPTIRQLLRHRQACGEITFSEVDTETGERVETGKTIKNYYPRVIDEKTWQLAQAALDRRTKQRGPRGDYVFLFSGICYSGTDKSQMHLHGSTRRLADGTKIKERRLKSYKAECGIKDADTCSIDMPTFEEAFLAFCQNIDPDALGKSDTTAEEIDLINARLANIGKNIADMKLDISSGAAGYTDLRPYIADATAEKNRLQEDLKKLQAISTTDAKQAFGSLLAYADDSSKREQLATAIKQIVDKIWVRSVKMGEARNAKIATCVQVLFRTGERRTFHMMKQYHVEFMKNDPFSHVQIEKIGNAKWQSSYRKLWDKTLPILKKMAERQEEIGDTGYVLL